MYTFAKVETRSGQHSHSSQDLADNPQGKQALSLAVGHLQKIGLN